MTRHFRLVRFRVGRALIHAGLRVLPPGRVQTELYALVDQWASRVRGRGGVKLFADPRFRTGALTALAWAWVALIIWGGVG